MPEPIRVPTFLVARHAFWDDHLEEMTACGVLSAFPINPETRTNDRLEVVVEFSPKLAERRYIEFRIDGLRDGERAEVYRAWHELQATADKPMAWVLFTLPTLPPDRWAFEEFAVELWEQDSRLAFRKLTRVDIVDVEGEG